MTLKRWVPVHYKKPFISKKNNLETYYNDTTICYVFCDLIYKYSLLCSYKKTYYNKKINPYNMIKKRKLRNQPYYKVYDTDFPYVIIYCTLEEANELINDQLIP